MKYLIGILWIAGWFWFGWLVRGWQMKSELRKATAELKAETERLAKAVKENQ